MYGYIYKTTDIDNTFIYIGQHSNWFVRKYNKLDPKYFGSGKIIQKWISKYGKADLRCEILCWCNSLDELNEKEIYYIKQFKAKYNTVCYNIAEGGQNSTIKYKSAEEKRLIKAKELHTKMNKPNEEKIALANRIRNTLLNKSIDEKTRISQQHSMTWKNKPEAEKYAREFNRLKTRNHWSKTQYEANSEACRKAKEKPVILTDKNQYLEFDSALKCSRALGWADCMAGMYIRKYGGIVKKHNSQYYNWFIYYK